jgi:membrane-bound inhibitor of C-type lysozyme
MRSFLLLLLLTPFTVASDLTISLPPGTAVDRHIVEMQCDAEAVRIGASPQPFRVEYINAGQIALAVLPIQGKPLVFANVISGSGARYAANRYIWWDAGARGITLSAPSMTGAGEDRGNCRVIKRE